MNLILTKLLYMCFDSKNKDCLCSKFPSTQLIDYKCFDMRYFLHEVGRVASRAVRARLGTGLAVLWGCNPVWDDLCDSVTLHRVVSPEDLPRRRTSKWSRDINLIWIWSNAVQSSIREHVVFLSKEYGNKN